MTATAAGQDGQPLCTFRCAACPAGASYVASTTVRNFVYLYLQNGYYSIALSRSQSFHFKLNMCSLFQPAVLVSRSLSRGLANIVALVQPAHRHRLPKDSEGRGELMGTWALPAVICSQDTTMVRAETEELRNAPGSHCAGFLL